MKKRKFEQSDFWKQINESQLSFNKIDNIDDFKSSDINYKIALFNPKTNGIRYLKTLIFNIASGLNKNEWTLLQNIAKRNFGKPITITYNNQQICLDYVQAIFELTFLLKNLQLGDASILEIGAGYDRTCHAIISNCDIKSYYIIDLANCLQLSRRYLKKVLPEKDYGKISFIRESNLSELGGIRFDLCINIDSFDEMNHDVVEVYLSFINQRCNFFYVKNPVGKYFDKSLDDHSQGNQVVELALSQGVLKDVIDIHNNVEVEKQAEKFLKAYSPGKGWQCLSNSWAKPWSYYWQAIYEKKGDQ
nr:putative sugar O-methyltransferase [Bacteroidota bacterium]